MKYQRNLNGHFVKSTVCLVFSILQIALAFYFFISYMSTENVSIFKYLYPMLLFIYGIVFYRISRGKVAWNAFIVIDDEKIEIKTIGSKKHILWNQIETIDLRDKKLQFFPIDKNFQYTSFKTLNPDIIDEIKSNITKFAAAKSIAIIE